MNIKNKVSVLALSLCATLLASCGKQHEAKSTVKGFITENFTGMDYSIDSYADLDSTAYVTAEAIKKMRQNADKNNAYRKGIKYAENNSKQLLYMSVTMEVKKEKVKHTFYLTKDVQEVVAFK